MTLLARVVDALASADIPFALIGASALAAHGVSRSTADIDLLTTDRRVLEPGTWPLRDVSIDMRTGDSDDPLFGVVRMRAPGDRDVDIVVGRHGWQAELIARASRITFEDATVPVVDAAGLVLLKLYAGGSQDAWDIERLLGAGDAAALVRAVDHDVFRLPRSARDLWDRLRDHDSGH